MAPMPVQSLSSLGPVHVCALLLVLAFSVYGTDDRKSLVYLLNTHPLPRDVYSFIKDMP